MRGSSKKSNIIYIVIFIIGGIFFRYVVDLLDMGFGAIKNLNTVQSTKIQLQLNKMVEECEGSDEEDTVVGGFVEMVEDYEEDEYE